MKTAVIIAFSYNYGNSYSNDITEHYTDQVPLPGIIIDLFLIYEFVKANKYKRIVVFTDIFSDINIDEIINPVTKGYVNSQIFTLIQDLKQRNEIIFYQNIDHFNDNFKQILSKASHLFLYYTGHAKPDHLVMPNLQNYCIMGQEPEQPKINNTDFIELILKNCPTDCQMLMLFDCCNGSNFKLPFYLNHQGVFHNTDINTCFYTERDIICFVSSMQDESSHCTCEGSPFTRLVIKQLQNKQTRTWSEILFNVQDKLTHIVNNQTVCLYSSLPNLNYIWSWLNFNSNLHLYWDNNFKLLDIKVVGNI